MTESQPSNIASGTPTASGIVGDYAKAVDRMTELTNAHVLKWDVADVADAKVSSQQKVLAAYDARYDNKTVRFLEMEAPIGSEGRLSLLMNGRRSENSLALIDRNGSPLFAFPKNLELIELLAAIKRQIADIDSFISALFADA